MEKTGVSTAIAIRLERFRQQSRVQAGSLITSVFGDAILPRGGRVWLGSLIQLLQPLGVNERLVRTAVFRLVKEEWLQSDAIGRRTDYMLTPSGRRRFDEAARQIYAANVPGWDRRWRLILVVGDLEARPRERLRRALFWQGFGEFASAGFVHPTADLGAIFDSLVSDGLTDLLPRLMPMLAISSKMVQSASDLDLVQKAWNLDGLAAAYAGFVEEYEPILEALIALGMDDVSDEDAFLVRTLLIHDVRRLLLRDPQLPESLLPQEWPGNRARALCREIYRRLRLSSERHLDAHVRLSTGDTPRSSQMILGRFELGSSLEMNVPVPA